MIVERMLRVIRLFVDSSIYASKLSAIAEKDKSVKRCYSMRSVSMQDFKMYVALPEVNEVLMESFKDNEFLAEILRDKYLNLSRRYQVVERYPLLVRMVYNPDSVESWRLEKTSTDIRKRVWKINAITDTDDSRKSEQQELFKE